MPKKVSDLPDVGEPKMTEEELNLEPAPEVEPAEEGVTGQPMPPPEEEEDVEPEDENPLHVVLKGSHAEELVSLLEPRGYTQLANALAEADYGETIEIKIVEED